MICVVTLLGPRIGDVACQKTRKQNVGQKDISLPIYGHSIRFNTGGSLLVLRGSCGRIAVGIAWTFVMVVVMVVVRMLVLPPTTTAMWRPPRRNNGIADGERHIAGFPLSLLAPNWGFLYKQIAQGYFPSANIVLFNLCWHWLPLSIYI